MVRSLQNDRAVARRDCAGKSRHTQNCESKRGRQPEFVSEVQYSRDSGAAFLQERATARSGYRRCQQEGSAQQAGSAGLETISLAGKCSGRIAAIALPQDTAERFWEDAPSAVDCKGDRKTQTRAVALRTFRRASVSRLLSVLLSHVSALLSRAVKWRPFPVVNTSLSVDPYKPVASA